MAPSFLSLRSILLLGALWSSVSAEAAGSLERRAGILSPRQGRCVDPGYIPVCPGPRPCILPGGICCSGGTFALPPDTCDDGTVPITTAPVSDVTSTIPAPVSTITTPVVIPPSVTEYTWYTRRYTYIYYTYWYTYYALSVDLFSTELTYYTTVSFTATDDVEASSLAISLSASISDELPTQTSTPTSGTQPAATSTPAETSHPSAPYPTTNGTVPSVTPPIDFTGAAASLRAGTASSFGSLFVLVTGAFMAIPGLLMLWL